jgi:hypothetical protein
LRFSPGDVLPLEWLRLRQPASPHPPLSLAALTAATTVEEAEVEAVIAQGGRELNPSSLNCNPSTDFARLETEPVIELKIIDGSLHLQSPSVSIAPESVLREASASPSNRWVHVKRLAAPGDGSEDPPGLLVISDAFNVGPSYGWEECRVQKTVLADGEGQNAAFAWRASPGCRLRAGGRGARVAMRLRQRTCGTEGQRSAYYGDAVQSHRDLTEIIRAIAVMLSSWDFDLGDRPASGAAVAKITSFLLPHTRLIFVRAGSRIDPGAIMSSSGCLESLATPAAPLIFLAGGTAAFQRSQLTPATDLPQPISVRVCNDSPTKPFPLLPIESSDDITLRYDDDAMRPSVCLLDTQSLLFESSGRHEIYSIAAGLTRAEAAERVRRPAPPQPRGLWTARSDCLLVSIDRST